MSLQRIPNITLIVAKTKNNVIGYGGCIPWSLKSDLKHFKETTLGKVVIMGRKTWESLPKRPLKDRTNIVISSSLEPTEGAIVYPSLDEALVNTKEEEVFIIGGSSLYIEAMDKASKLIVTEINSVCPGDTYFPEIDSTYWKVESQKDLKTYTDDAIINVENIEEIIEALEDSEEIFALKDGAVYKTEQEALDDLPWIPGDNSAFLIFNMEGDTMSYVIHQEKMISVVKFLMELRRIDYDVFDLDFKAIDSATVITYVRT